MSFLASFFASYWGQYIFQSVLHSLITLFIVERAIDVWGVESHLGRFRYRLSVIALPVFMYPVFQFISPERGSFFFRQADALFDGQRWLAVEIFGGVPAGAIVFTAAIGISTAVMLLQELVPISRDLFQNRGGYSYAEAGPEVKAILDGIIGGLIRGKGAHKPEIKIIEDEHPLIFTSGTKTIVLSDSLIKTLGPDQMRSALAHEAAHVLRRSNITTFLVFVLRLAMFYNPVSLIVFRRLVQDDEHVCDDITVSMTGDPRSLASALKVFYTPAAKGSCTIKGVREKIESSSHNLLLRERIERLEAGEGFEDNTFRWGRYFVTVLTAVAINYFVV